MMGQRVLRIFIILIPMAITVATLNINGLNVVNKQINLVSLLKICKIDVLMLQEHNVKDVKGMNYLLSDYIVLHKSSNNLKGGTAICIRKCSGIKVLSQEMDTEGQVTGSKIDFHGTIIFLLNVYAPSGANKKKDREEFFRDELIFYLRGNCENLIMGGDFNCVTSP